MEREPDLDFSASGHFYATHPIHAFAARCPPPLVRWAINRFTRLGDTVLDPMVGSGTTLVEAVLAGRRALGADIDPLARLIAKVKATPVPTQDLAQAGDEVGRLLAGASLDDGWRPELPQFDRWFRPDVASDLAALRVAIRATPATLDIQNVMWVALSSLIVARTSVANARDLVHSRHHYRAWDANPHVHDRFFRRLRQIQRYFADYSALLQKSALPMPESAIVGEDARSLRLPARSVDLVFTSPPYGSALDYTRAHIFAVGWLQEVLGTDPSKYRQLGREYIGTERAALREAAPGVIPPPTGIGEVDRVVAALAHDRKRAWIVYRYFRDMAAVLAEAFRALKPGGHLVLVVCPSNIRRVMVPTPDLLADTIGHLQLEDGGAEVLALHQRTLHERRRLMPYLETAFGIRMRTEYVLVARKVPRGPLGVMA